MCSFRYVKIEVSFLLLLLCKRVKRAFALASEWKRYMRLYFVWSLQFKYDTRRVVHVAFETG